MSISVNCENDTMVNPIREPDLLAKINELLDKYAIKSVNTEIPCSKLGTMSCAKDSGPMIRYNKNSIPKQPRESYFGNREYKRHLIFANNVTIDKKSTQMLFRLNEGSGKALYLIGVADCGKTTGLTYDEFIFSLENFIKMVNIVSSKIEKINIYELTNEQKYILTIRVSRELDPITWLD